VSRFEDPGPHVELFGGDGQALGDLLQDVGAGLRSPRSICDRYGLDTPASRASWRTETCACSRCSRMNSPMVAAFLASPGSRQPSQDPACPTALAIASGPASGLRHTPPAGKAPVRALRNRSLLSAAQGTLLEARPVAADLPECTV